MIMFDPSVQPNSRSPASKCSCWRKASSGGGLPGDRTDARYARPLRLGNERHECDTDSKNNRKLDQPHGHLGGDGRRESSRRELLAACRFQCSADRRAGRTRHPDTIVLDRGVEVAAASALGSSSGPPGGGLLSSSPGTCNSDGRCDSHSNARSRGGRSEPRPRLSGCAVLHTSAHNLRLLFDV